MRVVRCCCLLILLALLPNGSRADETFDRLIRPFFQQHCLECHDDKLSEGDLRLDTLPFEFAERPFAGHWIEVLDRINLGEMPPEDRERPDPKVLADVTDWIGTNLSAAREQREGTGGRVLLRRLTRLEYSNTVADLLHVKFVPSEGPIDLLPPDGSIRGFDRNAKALMVDPSLMNSYLQTAQAIANQAVRFRPPLVPEKTVRFEFRDMVNSAMSYQIQERGMYLEDDRVVVMQGNARGFAKLRHPFSDNTVPATGRYRVRVRAAADPGTRDEHVYMRVLQGPGDNGIAQFRVDASPDEPEVYEFETIRDAQFGGEYQVGIVNGTDLTTFVASRGRLGREADELAKAGQLAESIRLKTQLRAQGDHITGTFKPEAMRIDSLPKLYLDWIEVTGPLQEKFPPQSMRTIFFAGWEQQKLDLDYAKQIFQKLLPRAYRRRVKDSEVAEIVALVEEELERGHSYPEAIKTGFVAMLCSPKFLYMYEPNSNDSPRTLNNFEFATRLSYLLWSSKPDDHLYRLAGKRLLAKPDVLDAELDRMLSDNRIEGFINGFVRQWLRVDEFNRFPPDESIFPQFYRTEFVGLEEDLAEQPLAMIRQLILDDLPLTELLDSNWTMVNERLASFYELEPVMGDSFQRVDLGNQTVTRGGLLGMAGVHRWGSDGSRTKPVERGKYILDVLFNDPPPPPPPNAGEVEPNVRGEKLTVAERLAKHREQVTCNNCHRRIDPFGLALENFNVIGQWRDRIDGEKPLSRWGDDRPAIEIAGVLPNGREYHSFAEFKSELATQEERFLRGLTEKLLMYALARTTEASDRALINQIVAEAQANDSSFRSLLKPIIKSRAFRQK